MSEFARDEDPDTSHDAVPDPEDRRSQENKILSVYLYAGRPLRDDEAYEAVGLTTDNSAHRRCTTLRQEGLIRRVGKEKGKMNRSRMLCQITLLGKIVARSRGL